MKPPAVLVTGAGTRIGYTIAEHLAKQGCNLALHYRSSAAAQQLQQTYKQKITLHQADFSNSENVCTCADDVWRQHPELNTIINNAAIFPAHELADFDAQVLQHTYAVNCVAPLILTKSLADKRNSGLVINIVDCRIKQRQPARLVYTLSKHSLAMATQYCAAELAPSIRVNAICPGPVLAATSESNASLQAVIERTPMKQQVQLADICAAVDYLIQQQSVTGELLFIDSGQHLT